MQQLNPGPTHLRLVLGAYYLAIYAPIAISLSFFPVWMNWRGLTASQIGTVIAVGSVVRIFTNPALGYIADRVGNRKKIMLALLASSMVSSIGYFGADNFWRVLVIYGVTSIFWSGVIPLGESIVLPMLRDLKMDYGLMRRWGSVSVIFVSMGLGFALTVAEPGLVSGMYLIAFSTLFSIVWILPDREVEHQLRSSAPLREVLSSRRMWLLLGSAAVIQGAHGFFYAFGTLHWLENGLSAKTAGALWGLGVACEIIGFSVSGKLLDRFGPDVVIGIGGIVSILRWGLLATQDGIVSAMLVQIMQAGTLGLAQAGAARYMATNFPDRIMSSVTGVYYACGQGLLTAVCVFVAGQLHERIGSAIFLVAAALGAFAVVCSGCLMIVSSGERKHAL